MRSAIVDTSAIVAVLDESYAEHTELARIVTDGSLDLVVSPFVVAEADYMLATQLGPAAARQFGLDIVRGAYRLAPWRTDDHALASMVCERFAPEYIGVADAANVVVAAANDTTLILTLDQRHFRVLTPLTHGDAFTLLPYDA